MIKVKGGVEMVYDQGWVRVRTTGLGSKLRIVFRLYGGYLGALFVAGSMV